MFLPNIDDIFRSAEQRIVETHKTKTPLPAVLDACRVHAARNVSPNRTSLLRRAMSFLRDLSKLDGRWKLLFTNNVLGLGKLSPVTLKEVYQVVDSSERTVSNVVYAVLSPPMFCECSFSFFLSHKV